MEETSRSTNSAAADRAPHISRRRTWDMSLLQPTVMMAIAVLVLLGVLCVRLYTLDRVIEAEAADLAATRVQAKALAEEAARTTAAVRELTRTVNPKYDHVTCPAQNGRAEVDLGVPSPCPNPDDGQCVRGDMPLSVAQARCTAGKL